MKRVQAIAVFRMAVGIAQMTMALVTLGLYLQAGFNTWSLGALGITILLVIGSRIACAQK